MPESKTEAAETKSVKAPEPVEVNETKPEPVPFVEPVKTRPAPTAEQRNWLSNHPDYVPMAHSMLRFRDRGTLHADGSFISELKSPPMDGGGAMSVGIPFGRR